MYESMVTYEVFGEIWGFAWNDAFIMIFDEEWVRFMYDVL